MTSSILITKNLNLLYLSVQALDPYAMDKLSQCCPYLNLIDLFNNRTNSLLRYSSYASTYDIENTILLAGKLFNIASTPIFQSQIKLILQDISKEISNHNQYSSLTKNYIARFQAEYYESVEPYLAGKDSYVNKLWLKKLSFLNLFLLSKLSEPHGVYLLIIYINNNAFN